MVDDEPPKDPVSQDPEQEPDSSNNDLSPVDIIIIGSAIFLVSIWIIGEFESGSSVLFLETRNPGWYDLAKFGRYLGLIVIGYGILKTFV